MTNGPDRSLYHYTLMADGAIVEPPPEFEGPAGPAVMAIKAWAPDQAAAADMMISLANRLGFKITKSVDLYETEPARPAQDQPYAYDIQFTPYDGSDTT